MTLSTTEDTGDTEEETSPVADCAIGDSVSSVSTVVAR